MPLEFADSEIEQILRTYRVSELHESDDTIYAMRPDLTLVYVDQGWNKIAAENGDQLQFHSDGRLGDLFPCVGGKLMRDPSIVQGPDGLFHMVWSSGWWGLGFGYSSSRDLIHWSEHRFIPVNQDVAGAKNTWAPDLFFDDATAFSV